MRRLPLVLLSFALTAGGLTALAPQAASAAVPNATPCTSPNPGEVTVVWFDVEQGDSQLVIGPTGRTLLVDLGETAWNATTGTKAESVAARIRSACGVTSGPVHLDYVLASHHHLDHIGYAGNPNDTTAYGNGLWRLLHQDHLGFTVGTVLDRDGGTWTDADGDNRCDVGTSSAPAPEVAWNNAGTVSQTSRRWICWLYGPAGQRDRAAIEGKVVTLRNTVAFPSLDLGAGVTTRIVQANAKGVLQADGVTPVSGDHTSDPVPPSENDYSVAVKVQYGGWSYATAGDTDGEYSTSSFGYSYNDVERGLVSAFGDVSTARANHHGSSHSSSAAYVGGLDPETAFVSCGTNSYGHPANRVLDAFQAAGADVYLANNPCDTTDGSGAAIDYTGTFNSNGDVRLRTTGAGAGYVVTHDTGSRSYSTGSTASPGTPSSVRVNEYLMAPSTGNEWVELYNPTSTSLAIGGLWIDDVAGGGGAPKQIPAGTTIAPGGRWVMEFASGFLNNTGSESVRLLATDKTTEYDVHTYSLGSTQSDKVFRRSGDGGAWCTAISTGPTKGTPNPTAC
ncbi:MAG: lamin tail domain-containing protein [Mycobacteriales bacterium]|nr:lamin tail domain-containing protein [Mycobacteriales bacterium]